jgi:alpha-D-xyloside xylohydrolase
VKPLLFASCLVIVTLLSPLQGNPASVERLADGILLPVAGGFLRVRIEADSIVRVLFSTDRTPRVNEMVVVGTDDGARLAALNPFGSSRPPAAAPRTPKWSLETTATTAVLATATLRVSVSLADGAVTYADAAGREILAEVPGAREMTPATVQGERTHHVRQRWRGADDESLYGLGQRQEGRLDLKGLDLDLWQRNTVVAVPFVVSSRGYGLLWDNTSFTRFGASPDAPIGYSPAAAGKAVAYRGDAVRVTF